jgi:hypothetical protein
MQLYFRLFGHLIVATWIVVITMLLSIPRPALADNSTIVPFSLNRQSSKFTREDLREIFFGRRTQWPDGSPLKVYVLPDQNAVHIRFVKEILGIYPYQLRSAWDRMIYSGTGVPPIVVDSVEQMQIKIQQTPDAIGYIEK